MEKNGVPTISNEITHSTSDAKKLAKLKSQDCHCLSCPHTKKAYGSKLLCKLKNKLVNQYNICTYWGEVIVK